MNGLGLGLQFYSLSPAEKINRIKQRAKEIVKEGKQKRSLMMAAYGGLVSGPMKRESRPVFFCLRCEGLERDGTEEARGGGEGSVELTRSPFPLSHLLLLRLPSSPHRSAFGSFPSLIGFLYPTGGSRFGVVGRTWNPGSHRVRDLR